MSLAKFYYGTIADLDQQPYEEGSIYFVFAEPNATSLGHIYLDINNLRREISSSYNDSNLILRLAELERVTLVHCEGILLDDEKRLALDSTLTLLAEISPAGTTDMVNWTSSDETVAILDDLTYNRETGEASAIVRPLQAGECTITISCGNYFASCELEVIDENWYIDNILAENYSPAGSDFFYQAPISLSDGQYIEIKVDLSGVNAIKQNLISIGENIDKFTESRTPKIHVYSSQTLANKETHLRFAFLYTTNKSGIEYAIPNRNGSSVVTIKLDYDGLWINGVAFVCPDNTGKAIYESIMEAFRLKNSFDVGSQEGANRSTAYYEYIKYVSYEPTE